MPPLRRRGGGSEGTYRLDGTGASAADGYLALARQYEGEARHVLALNAYRKAAHLVPNDADVLNALGLALARQSQHSAAVVAFRQAVALDPTRSALLNNLGYALVLEGRVDEARGFLRQALLQEPGHRLAQINLDRLRPLGSVIPPSGQLSVADALGLGVDPAKSVAPLHPSETSASAEEPWPTVQLRVSPNVEAFSLTFADAEGAGPAATDARLDHLDDADPSWPLVSKVSAPVQVDRDYAAVRIEISNGNGVQGMGARLGQALRSSHLADAVRLTNMRRFDLDTTVVEYRPGFVKQAQIIANYLGASAVVPSTQTDLRQTDIRVLLGRDLETAITCAACTQSGSRIKVAAALRSHATAH